jgi:hypothetical protein
MDVLFPVRRFGRIDEIAGEYTATRFAHLVGLPLVPLGAVWVRPRAGTEHPEPLSVRSVIAGYARTWGVIVALFAAWLGGAAGWATAAAAALLTAGTWWWRRLRDPRARRRAEAMLAVIGSACEPRRMPRDLAHAIRAELLARWVEVCCGRSPDDVARFGAETPAQASLAYALLRMAGRDDDAARILDGTCAPAVDGPYRRAAPRERSRAPVS